jgi:putative transposase
VRERRRIVTEVQAAWGISERRVARFTGFARSSLRYRTVRDPVPELRARIRELAAERPRWGYRRIHVMLGREGWTVNRKRVLRLYREDGLLVRRKGKRRRSQAPRPVREPIGEPNQRWSIDFVHDALANGRRFRCLTVLDEFTRESLAIEVDYSLPSSRVIEVLERLREQRGLPRIIVSDNGSEFASRAFDAWAYARAVQILFIQPGRPVQNCFIESFNGTFRDECLNLHWFRTIAEARFTIEAFRNDYNTVRPHSSLGDLSPSQVWNRSRSAVPTNCG